MAATFWEGLGPLKVPRPSSSAGMAILVPVGLRGRLLPGDLGTGPLVGARAHPPPVGRGVQAGRITSQGPEAGCDNRLLQLGLPAPRVVDK